jgi:hypothetical protein
VIRLALARALHAAMRTLPATWTSVRLAYCSSAQMLLRLLRVRCLLLCLHLRHRCRLLTLRRLRLLLHQRTRSRRLRALHLCPLLRRPQHQHPLRHRCLRHSKHILTSVVIQQGCAHVMHAVLLICLQCSRGALNVYSCLAQSCQLLLLQHHQPEHRLLRQRLHRAQVRHQCQRLIPRHLLLPQL